ncbi:MAG: prephenate dehydrogenase [Parasporobacterium sp.]|nr:prephenate dehydrogenase [Parasporobacterium sp.]
MTVGIAGLGLIGGSFAKAYHAAGERVLAYNRNKDTLAFAMLNGDVDAELTDENVHECDIIIICVFPEAAAAYLESIAPYIRKDTIVMDACGTKRKVCSLCFPIAEKYGFTYVGGHPMAGTKYSGFKYALTDMYVGQPMVIVPRDFSDIFLLDKIKSLLSPVGFGSISVTTAEAHDRMIAFTSQMAHVVSSSYIKSPTATEHKGFSAGSYKDMTRVAWLNPDLWSELLLENRDCILNELDTFIDNLMNFRNAIDSNDQETLRQLLDEGRRRKEEVDG